MSDRRILYLYSSNIQPLYEQDILDLLAAPNGQLHSFRYLGRDLVAPDVLAEWANLQGTGVLIHFALQQESHYHEPAFIPVRHATVVKTERSGSINLVRFTLDRYAALMPPEKLPTGSRENSKGRIVQQYATWLKAQQVPRPYEYWVGFGPEPTAGAAPLDENPDPLVLFDRTAEYLSQTSSFRKARFYRVEGIHRLESSDTEVETVEPLQGCFELEGGRTYGLRISHMQPVDVVQPQKFSIVADGEIVQPIGSGSFEIASRYDVFTLPLHATEPPTSEPRETVVAIEPTEGLQAGRVRLHVRVLRPGSRAAAAVGGSATAALLLGLPGLWPTAPVTLKALCVVVATLLLGILAAKGLGRA